VSAREDPGHAAGGASSGSGGAVEAPPQKKPTAKQIARARRKLVEAEDFTGAIAVYQRQLPWSQKIPEFFLALATYRLVKEISQQPWQLIDRRLPSTQQCQFSLCTGLQSGNLEDNAGAATAYRRTIELDRNYLNAYLGLGVVLLRQETTTRLFGHTSKCSPANLIMPMLMNWWVRCWCSRDAPKKRSQHSKSATLVLKHQCVLLLGSVWVSQGNITAGLMTLKKAAQVDPRNVKVHLQMGEILRAQNDLDGALSAYRQALTVQPSRSTGSYRWYFTD